MAGEFTKLVTIKKNENTHLGKNNFHLVRNRYSVPLLGKKGFVESFQETLKIHMV